MRNPRCVGGVAWRPWRTFLVACLLACILAAMPTAARAGDEPLKAQFDALAEPLVSQGYAAGVTVAVVREGGTTILSYGKVALGSKVAPDARTVFPIGSVTKLFTTLLLAEEARRGRVGLQDPLESHLPRLVRMHRLPGRSMTLEDLATHSAGFPRMPDNWSPANPYNPCADYTVEMLYQYLATCRLTREPGQAYEYSNVGSGLLGHLLARREGKSFEALLLERVCLPLGMTSTRITLQADQFSRAVQGQDLVATPMPRWEWQDSLAGYGALCSTPEDMAKFLRAEMGLGGAGASSLMQAMASTQRPLRPEADRAWKIGLGWHVSPDGTLLWHDGGIYGAYAFVGINKATGTGIAWLSNSNLWQLPPLLGRLQAVLKGERVAPLRLQRLVRVSPGSLDACTGTYEKQAGSTFTVRKEDDTLVMSVGNSSTGVSLWPTSDREFVMLETEGLSATFTTDEQGKVDSLRLRSPDRETVARRIR